MSTEKGSKTDPEKNQILLNQTKSESKEEHEEQIRFDLKPTTKCQNETKNRLCEGDNRHSETTIDPKIENENKNKTESPPL